MSNVKFNIKISGLAQLQKRLDKLSGVVKKYDQDKATVSVEADKGVMQDHVMDFITPEEYAAQNEVIKEISKELDNV